MIRTRLLRALAAVGMVSSTALSEEFSLCKFNFGVDWSQHLAKHCSHYRPNCKSLSDLQIPANINFLASFVGWTQDGSTKIPPAPKADKEGEMLNDAKTLSATPVWYTYIIAEGAKLAKNLSDCNTGGGSSTLCVGGAAYIKENRAKILEQYSTYASFAASRWGTSKPMIWALEPDFIQYTEGSQSNPLSMADGKKLLSDIIDVIQSKMPNAWISMDISPWKDQAAVIPALVPLDKVKFMNTSGGISQPNANIKNKEATWASVWTASGGKGMIADDGYGTGGGATSPNPAWSDANNLKARINDGVIALMEAVPGSSWGNTISNLQTQLSGTKLKTCGGETPVKPKYTLTVTSPNNGTVALSPSGGTYDSGASVTVTATASNGYSFTAWTGASTSTSSPVTIVMTGDKTIGATFTSNSKPKPKYTLTVTTPSNGTIALSPSGGTYDSGTTVTASASAVGNYSFSAWTGASTSTTSPVSIVMTGDKTLGATFVPDNSPVKLVVSATNGTVTMSPVMPAAGYARGTAVTLTAAASAGFDFTGWSGDATGSAATITITMDAAKNVTAGFRKQGQAVSLLQGGDCSDVAKWTPWGAFSNGWTIKSMDEPENTSNKVCYVKENNYQSAPDTTLKMTQKGFTVAKGATYFLSFRARVERKDDVRGAHPIAVRVLANGSQIFKKSDSIPQDSGTWHDYGYSFTPSVGGTGQLDFLHGGSNQLSWQGIYLDDIVLADAPVSVQPRKARKVSDIAAWYAKGVLSIRVARMGRASFSLVSPSGQDALDLGSHALDGSGLSMHLGSRATGLRILVARGEGWEAAVPVLLGN